MDDINQAIEKKLESIKNKGASLNRRFKKESLGYITTALGLVAGLAWNDAIKAFIEHFFPLDKNTVFAKFLYAVLITVFVVFIAKSLINKVSGEEE